MGAIRLGVPLILARKLCLHFDLQTAVETGTYQGDSAVTLATIAREVWSIELSSELHHVAQNQFSDRPNLHFVQGSSVTVLPDVLTHSNGPALFWLDGNWSGGKTAGVEAECPLIDEIGLIDAWDHGGRSCILIDDARLFLGPPPPPHDRKHWPAFIDVVDKLRSMHSRYVTVLDDVIIAGPPPARGLVEDYWLQVQSGEVQESP